MAGVDEARESLATEGALEVDGIGSTGLGVGNANGAGVAGAGVTGPPLLRLMWFVISVLKASRSAVAMGGGAVKEKVWPSGYDVNTSFILTCAAPTLLQKRAGTTL